RAAVVEDAPALSGTIVDPNDGRRAENSTPLSQATAFSRIGELFNLNSFICLGNILSWGRCGYVF
ncbi:hypothetical protein, partial [Pseudomonas viridiflava]|uniref:hypothetical protein n=1 Tax=Pseudomonas viridiflava TaxID=33069 RepID=UPI00197D5C0B